MLSRLKRTLHLTLHITEEEGETWHLSDLSQARQLIMKSKLEPRSPALQFTETKTSHELLSGLVSALQAAGY